MPGQLLPNDVFEKGLGGSGDVTKMYARAKAFPSQLGGQDPDGFFGKGGGDVRVGEVQDDLVPSLKHAREGFPDGDAVRASGELSDLLTKPEAGFR